MGYASMLDCLVSCFYRSTFDFGGNQQLCQSNGVELISIQPVTHQLEEALQSHYKQSAEPQNTKNSSITTPNSEESCIALVPYLVKNQIIFHKERVPTNPNLAYNSLFSQYPNKQDTNARPCLDIEKIYRLN